MSSVDVPLTTPPDDRLDTWKEIANYLKRDVRTVKRWEQSHGLPVHRHQHRVRASVFAYRHELDAWWQGDTRPSPRLRPFSQLASRRWVGAAAAAFALLALLITFGLERSSLSPVTTSSTEALRLYLRAQTLLSGHGNPSGIQASAALAEELLEEAIGFDPDFASAYLQLAIARFHQGVPQSEYRNVALRAFELRDAVSDRERLTIEGGYSWLTGDINSAISTLEALTTIYPDDSWGLGGLSDLYRHAGRERDAEAAIVRLAELDADDFLHNALAASNLLMRGDSTTLDDAERYAQRAMRVAPASGSQNWLLRARMVLFPAYVHWIRGDVRATENEVDRIAETLNTRGRGEAAAIRNHLLSVYLSLGKLNAARALAQGMTAEPQELALAGIAFAGGFDALAREHAGNWVRLATQVGRKRSPGNWTIAWLGVGGELVSRVPPSGRPEAIALYELDAGLRALSAGEYRRAIELLESGLGPWQATNSHGLFQLFGALADAQLAVGQVDAAVLTLESGSRLRGRAAVTGNGYWIRNQWQLAQLYEEQGFLSQAHSIRDDLALLLAVADQDHPIASQVRAFSRPDRLVQHEVGNSVAQLATHRVDGRSVPLIDRARVTTSQRLPSSCDR